MLFFKKKTAYEMRISDWSSDVCSSDLDGLGVAGGASVAGGVTVTDVGLTVTAGGVVVTAGGLTVADGVVVSSGGADVTGGASVAGGVTVSDVGLTVTAGGVSRSDDGVVGQAGGIRCACGWLPYFVRIQTFLSINLPSFFFLLFFLVVFSYVSFFF